VKYNPRLKIYIIDWHKPIFWGAFYQKDNVIMVVKQKNKSATIFLLLHELGHWLIELLGGKWHKQYDFPFRLYDKLKLLIKKENYLFR